MGLKDVGSKLPPGFRFHPSDKELVCHYLCNKIRAKSDHGDVEDDEASKDANDLVEIDLHICEPWQLPDVAKLNAKEWYFFSFRDRKYATGYRTNRATISGYWKATGKDRTVVDPRTKELVGMRKTLVFYRNRAPNGIKTTWIMHEFRLECLNLPPKEDWVLCRVFNKGRDISSLQDNTDNNDDQTQKFEINDAPNLNYNNQLPPLLSSTTIDPPHHHDEMTIQVCDQWEQLLKQLSRATDHPYNHHCHHQTIACGLDQMMSSSSSHGLDHESLLNFIYVDNNNSVNINDEHHQNYEKELLSDDTTRLEHLKTCMGSSLDGCMVSDLQMECGGLSFETDSLLAFH